MCEQDLFNQYAPIIHRLTAQELSGGAGLIEKLLMAKEGKFEICYTPFEYLNQAARIVIVGITPGRTQMVNAIQELRRQLDRGASKDQALRTAKTTGAFSGEMRKYLTAMLDEINVHGLLGLNSCSQLFSERSDLVHTTSLLRNAVFYGGENYGGTPSMLRNRLLSDCLMRDFVAEVEALPQALFLPLGSKVSSVFERLIRHGALPQARVLPGLPHPSGQNIERIRYFLGRSARGALSPKTNAAKIDAAKERLVLTVTNLAGAHRVTA